MFKNTNKDNVLSKYFFELSTENQEIPYMTKIAIDTGVSVATISRYARRKGFFNFSEMRANFNRGVSNNYHLDINNESLLEFLRSNDTFYIATSKSTRLLGEYIKTRLDNLGFATEIINSTKEAEGILNKNSATIIVTLSGESFFINKLLKEFDCSGAISISTKPLNNLKVAKQVVLRNFDYKTRSSYEVFGALWRVCNWVHEVLNIFHLEKMKENRK